MAHDDLVARLDATANDTRHNITPFVRALLSAASEALTSRHTGDVVGWTGNGSIRALAQGRDGYIWPSQDDAHPIALVTKSSYSALAAAKARAEEEYLRAWNERDAQRRRAEAAERERDEALRQIKDEGSAR